MNLIQLQYFIQVAETGSFRKTAEKNYISQPAVSKHIALLEKEWGFSLFNRGYRTATLTESGKIMYDSLKEGYREYLDKLELAKTKGEGFQSLITIGVPEASHMGNLPELINEISVENPGIIVHIKSLPITELLIDQADSGLDIAICFERNIHNYDKIEAVKISRHRNVALISKHHPLCQNGLPKFEDLKNEKAFQPAKKNTDMTIDFCNYICAQHGFTPRAVSILPNIESVCFAVKMCLGFTAVDDMVVLPEHFELLPVPSNAYFNLMLAWHKDSQNPAVKKCVDKLAKELKIEPVNI